MARTISIGCQDFEMIRREGYFYIDKTVFLSKWWEGGDCVTDYKAAQIWQDTVYDTPMQEAYVNGYWEEMVSFNRSLFNSTFKTNPQYEQGDAVHVQQL